MSRLSSMLIHYVYGVGTVTGFIFGDEITLHTPNTTLCYVLINHL